jgi:predicted SAM-dependent methyltransferase
MKLHLGCGPVYLEGYINIDIPLDTHYLAEQRPDLVEKNLTTVDKYYKHKVTREDIESKKLQKQEVVCDMFCDIVDLPAKFGKNSVEEIRIVQVFEHFDYALGGALLYAWHKMLKKDGILHIDVPDLELMWKEYISWAQDYVPGDKESKAEIDWNLRLMFGSFKNEYSVHHSAYTFYHLKALMEHVGFEDIQKKKNIHFYPAIALEGRKA